MGTKNHLKEKGLQKRNRCKKMAKESERNGSEGRMVDIHDRMAKVRGCKETSRKQINSCRGFKTAR